MEDRLISLMKKSTMIDKPRYYSREEYNNASREYLKILNPKKNNIKSVYQVGSIGVPGISDIDYFIVYKNDKNDFFGKYHILNLSKDSKYMFYHNCWFVNEKVIENLGYWFPFFNLDKVYGDIINIKKIKEIEIDLILATQYLISKIPYDLIDYSIKRKKFYQRTMLVSIHSLRHTVKLIDRIGYAKKNWLSFCEEFDRFRKNWFKEKNREDRLIKFSAKSILISLDIIEMFDKILIENFNIQAPKDSFKLHSGNKDFYFLNKWDKDKILKKYMIQKFKDIRYYPSSFAYYLYLRSIDNGNLGKQMRKKFPRNIKYSVPKNIKTSFSKYEQILNEFNEFNKKKFWMTANGYHTLWASYYAENSSLNYIYDKIFKTRELSIIIFKKIFS